MNRDDTLRVIKSLTKDYILAPKLLNFILGCWGRFRKYPSYTNKQRFQYPYCWQGEVFGPARGGQYLEDKFSKKLVCYTRNYETKAVFLPSSDEVIRLSGLAENATHLKCAVSTAQLDGNARDLDVEVNGEIVVQITGRLIRDGWQHLEIPLTKVSEEVVLRLRWSGGQVLVSEPIPSKKAVKEKYFEVSSFPQKKPNVIVLVLDSLMAESVGCLKPKSIGKSNTPEIDRYFDKGMLFTNAYSVSEYTMPSLATMASGLYPVQHGVFTHDKNQRELPIGIPTLAEKLQQSGYRTLAYSTGARFSPLYGHYRGYDRFFQHSMSHSNTADVQVNKLIEFLAAHEQEPCFAFLHLIDPHPPFPLPTYYSDMAAGLSRWGDSRELYSAFKLHQDSSGYVNQLRTVERAMIRNTDMILSKIFAYLTYTNANENTYVLLLADHGREYKKGTPLLTKNLTNIPLLIQGPGVEPAICAAFSEAPLDLYPTVMSIAGILPPEHVSGISLVDGDAAKRDFCISESLFRRVGEIVLRTESLVYGFRDEFDYMNGNLLETEGRKEWLFNRNPLSGAEDYSKNLVSEESAVINDYRSKAIDHLYGLPRYYDNEHILEFSRSYPE